ncbi:MAG: hypothetical protein L0Y56_11855, partial [Nitrospira sp.]|nr:hypothetical protein [Nitrospira sp.]
LGNPCVQLVLLVHQKSILGRESSLEPLNEIQGAFVRPEDMTPVAKKESVIFRPSEVLVSAGDNVGGLEKFG